GDIRYFSLGIEELVAGIVAAAKSARELVNDVKAVRDLQAANREVSKAEADQARLDDQLKKAVEDDRRNTSLKAREQIVDLAGPAYAEAVGLGKSGSELPPKEGKIRNATDSLVSAQSKKKAAEDKVKARVAKKLKTTSAGIVLDVGEAGGSLLGAEVNVGLGISLGLASLTRNLGGVQVTLPDVNLRSAGPDQSGVLSATTDDFVRNSEQDLKRQIASARLDLGALIPGFPGGSYNVTIGPLSLDVTTVSYNVGPQLNVTQDVQASPLVNDQSMTYEFFRSDGTTPEFLQVTINGVPWQSGAFVHSVTFAEGDRVEILGRDRDSNGSVDPIVVQPSLTVGARFSNDIGLDVDLDGSFSALGLTLSALGEELVSVGPLLRHQHTLHTFDIGSVFNKAFDLGTQSLTLNRFTLFDAVARGRTVDAPLTARPTATPDQLEAVSDAQALVPVFVEADLISETDKSMGYSQIEIQTTGGATLAAVEVLDDGLEITENPGSHSFTISGYTARMLHGNGSSLFAVRFASNVADATIRVIRQAPISLTDNGGQIGSSSLLLTEDDFEKINATAIYSNDIDGDGFVRPETDGILLIRYLAGFTGDALIGGALGASATRTTSEAVAAYIRQTLTQALPETTFGRTVNTLDFDGDGKTSALGDGVLLFRYLSGKTGTDLTDGLLGPGASRQTAADIIDFIEIHRANAGQPNVDEFNMIVDRTGADVFGLHGLSDPAPDAVAGSSAAAAQPNSGSSGAGGFAPADGSSGLMFTLNTWGQLVDYRELYLNSILPANLVSRIAIGSPTDFGSEAHRALLNSGGNSAVLQEQVISSVLGVDSPLFIKAEDSGGYEYSTGNGFRFHRITIDPQVGGNLYQNARFDLYLKDAGSGAWVFHRLLTNEDPSLVQPDGTIDFPLPGNGVSEFRLYQAALPNTALHDEENLTRPEIQFSTGLTFLVDPGTPGVPFVTMASLAPRIPFGDIPSIRIQTPVFASDTATVLSQFRVERNLHEEVVTASTSGLGTVPTPLRVLVGSTEAVRIDGNDNVSDTLWLDLSNGPLRTPVRYSGGFRTDTLLVTGASAAIDLVDRDGNTLTDPAPLAGMQPVQLSEVEVIDLRGAGDITLLLNENAVLANDPFHNTLHVRVDPGDAVVKEDGWMADGEVTESGVTWEVFVKGRATLMVEKVISAPPSADFASTEVEIPSIGAPPRESQTPDESAISTVFISGFSPIRTAPLAVTPFAETMDDVAASIRRLLLAQQLSLNETPVNRIDARQSDSSAHRTWSDFSGSMGDSNAESAELIPSSELDDVFEHVQHLLDPIVQDSVLLGTDN
ncbi:MAG: hypothetical protein KDA96_12095, partial [Planctomycetaceae bacterium]|nr:hypothetical protein [Planctomycetaceae bacterium]